ncbi:hypothetical protein RN001_000714 [Aquatica leii]|uniref:Luciferin 4-monooxygenase n=1 Tax=Aquatica leii TaxID=1421715 RepID=A0AAN7SQM6_9COLE|nr:hypothetical protein RN001_000714 [Aquatica leii]
MRTEENILVGPSPVLPVQDGTAGHYLFNVLKKYIYLPSCITEAETGLKISYKQLLEGTCRLAQSFINNGYCANTVISICSENNIYYMYPAIAALYIGLIVAPVNPNYTERELLHVLNISKPKLMFCSKTTLSKILQIKKKLSFLQKIIVLDSIENIDNTESIINFINGSCKNDLNIEKFDTVKFNRDEQVAAVLCSSGTTGLPKGVMLTHKNLMVRFMHCRDPEFGTAQHLNKGGAILSFMPLFHNFGFLTTLGYLTLGVHIVQMQRYNDKIFLESLQKYKVESTLVVPPIMIFLVKNSIVNQYDLSSLKEIGCGAAPLSKETIEETVKKLNIKNVRQGYGLTETTLLTVFSPLNSNKIGSTGKLLPLVSAKIIDCDTGKSLGPYKNGEICVKGDVLMKGYMNNIDATQNTIDREGWLHTGDVGYYDDEEYFYIVDRIKELIKYKGYQVAPAELEALLLDHPSIKEVAVVGKPDYLAGELPTAFIVTQPGKKVTETEIHEFLTGKISQEKRLRGGIRFIGAIPRNSTGKILRRELRQVLQHESKL